jgi:hypothetical protein
VGGPGEEAEAFHLGTEGDVREAAQHEIERLRAIIASEPDSAARERWKLQLEALEQGVDSTEESDRTVH